MPKNYEGLFIFAGSIKEEALDKVIERATAEIEKLGGTIENTESLGRRNFARPMNKRDHGVYVKIRFSLAPEQLVPLRARFKLNDDIFRVQFVLRNERVEAAKAVDDARRAAYKASIETAAADGNNEDAPAGESDSGNSPADNRREV